MLTLGLFVTPHVRTGRHDRARSGRKPSIEQPQAECTNTHQTPHGPPANTSTNTHARTGRSVGRERGPCSCCAHLLEIGFLRILPANRRTHLPSPFSPSLSLPGVRTVRERVKKHRTCRTRSQDSRRQEHRGVQAGATGGGRAGRASELACFIPSTTHHSRASTRLQMCNSAILPSSIPLVCFLF